MHYPCAILFSSALTKIYRYLPNWLWRRANARNVSLYWNSLRWLIYVFNSDVNNKLPVRLSHQRNTTVSIRKKTFLSCVVVSMLVWKMADRLPRESKNFLGLISTTSSVVFIAARIAYISFLHRSAHIWFSKISSHYSSSNNCLLYFYI